MQYPKQWLKRMLGDEGIGEKTSEYLIMSNAKRVSNLCIPSI
jgi:hypothetical protein